MFSDIPDNVAGGDTIVAPASAPGAAAVAMVRVSGPEAWPMVMRLFAALQPESPPRRAIFGRLETPDGVADDALVLPFRGPSSYTGEDVVEIHLHGSDVIVSAVVASLTQQGARPAAPGEFTQRAFLNGKLDLAQAEAVAELISAKSALAAKGAAARLAGSLSTRYAFLREQLLEIRVHLEATIDFPEEDIETLGYPRLLDDVQSLRQAMAELAGTFEDGRIELEGLRVAIAGRPNVGKSSLLNALLQSDRAIVTAIAGTTRDYLEESLQVNGATVRLVDTAGLRETTDVIEAEGIRRTEAKLAEADLVLYVVDATLADPEDKDIATKFLAPEQAVFVVNKIDVAPDFCFALTPCFRVSALSGQGMEDLRNYIGWRAAGSDSDTGMRVVSARQQRLLTRVGDALAAVETGLTERHAPELVVEELRDALEAAGELTGQIATDEVLSEIFARFCIGK